MIEVEVTGTLPKGLSQEVLERACSATLKKMKNTRKATSVSVSFVSDVRMKALNKKYRKKNKTTDVLSFSEPLVPTNKNAPQHLGDIFISPVYVRHEAARRRIEFREELLRMTVHGMLHLLGLDHATEETELEMFGLQEKILASVLDI